MHEQPIDSAEQEAILAGAKTSALGTCLQRETEERLRQHEDLAQVYAEASAAAEKRRQQAYATACAFAEKQLHGCSRGRLQPAGAPPQ